MKNNIRKIRKEKCFTVKQVADVLLVTNSVIDRYERGIITPSIEKIQKLSLFLGCTPNDLIIGEWNNPPEDETMKKIMSLNPKTRDLIVELLV